MRSKFLIACYILQNKKKILSFSLILKNIRLPNDKLFYIRVCFFFDAYVLLNTEDRLMRVLRKYVTKMKIVIRRAVILYFTNIENKPWASDGIVRWDVEASSKLIVDSRTIAIQ